MVTTWDSQVAAGTSLIRKLQEGFVSQTSLQRLAWVDAHGYDGWPALSVLEVQVV